MRELVDSAEEMELSGAKSMVGLGGQFPPY